MTGGATVLVAGCSYRARWARGLRTWDLRLGGGAIELLEAPNGAGKSTFLRAVAGVQPARWRARRIEGRLRFVPAAVGTPPMLRVDDHLALLGARAGVAPADLEQAIDRWQLTHLRRRFGDGLSAGERQAVGLAVAFAPGIGPEVIVLDEPTVALDEVRRTLLDDELLAAARRGAVVLLADHDRDLRRRFGPLDQGASS